MAYVELKIGGLHIFDDHLATLVHIESSSFVSLTFTDQNNGVKREKLSHMSNGQPFVFPACATTCRVPHLIQHNSPATTPIHLYFDDQGWKRSVTSSIITRLLQTNDLTILGYSGVDPDNITARSLHSSGAMEILLVRFDTNHICIIGLCNSDVMF